MLYFSFVNAIYHSNLGIIRNYNCKIKYKIKRVSKLTLKIKALNKLKSSTILIASII